MSNNSPLISIITATFNSEKTLKDTIKSLLNQTFLDFEYIIIDGKSTDKTLSIIKSFENRFKEKGIQFTWISEQDTGIYNAFNKGVKIANGNWISFLGSDDYYFENALELYTNQIKSLKSYKDLVHSNVNLGNRKIINDKWTWRSFRRKMVLAHAGAFHNKLFFEKYGLFNESYKIAGDYEILLRARENLKTHWFNALTVFMSDGGASNHEVIKVYKETKKAILENKSLNSAETELNYLIWIFKYKVKMILNAFIR